MTKTSSQPSRDMTGNIMLLMLALQSSDCVVEDGWIPQQVLRDRYLLGNPIVNDKKSPEYVAYKQRFSKSVTALIYGGTLICKNGIHGKKAALLLKINPDNPYVGDNENENVSE